MTASMMMSGCSISWSTLTKHYVSAFDACNQIWNTSESWRSSNASLHTHAWCVYFSFFFFFFAFLLLLFFCSFLGRVPFFISLFSIFFYLFFSFFLLRSFFQFLLRAEYSIEFINIHEGFVRRDGGVEILLPSFSLHINDINEILWKRK